MNGRRLVRFQALIVLPLAVLALTAGQCNTAPDHPPVANAGADRTGTVGEAVTLDGAASSDPDGDALSFRWDLEQRPSGSAATLADPDTSTPSFTPDATGGYVATLTVTAGQRQASDDVTVTVSDGDGANLAPTLVAIEDQRTFTNQVIEVPFSVSDEDPSSLTFEATSDDQTLVADGDIDVSAAGAEGTVRVTPAFDGAGSVRITLLVRDASGLQASVAFTLEVRAAFATQFPKLSASDASKDSQFGFAVAISGNHAVIGAPYTDEDGANAGAAYAFHRSNDTWGQNTRLPPAPPVVALTTHAVTAGDQFGTSVAIDGTFAIVGAPGDDLMGSNAGAAYVFERCGPRTACTRPWSEVAKLAADDGAEQDQFGRSVAIDGDYAVVGARGDNHGGHTDAGAAYVFQRSGDTWIQLTKLTADDAAAQHQFGFSVAISGEHAVVGAPGAAAGGGADAGVAYVFRRSGDAWNQRAKLTANDAAANDLLGWSVAIDGDRVLVGAILDSDAGSGSGSAYVFQPDGAAWTQTAKLTADDAFADDLFGISVAIRGDRALVGASRGNEGSTESGAAYAFQHDGTAWTQLAKLTSSDPAAGDTLGWSVALDLDHALVGAPNDDDAGLSSGAAHMFLE